jgi:hypothetical protein
MHNIAASMHLRMAGTRLKWLKLKGQMKMKRACVEMPGGERIKRKDEFNLA